MKKLSCAAVLMCYGILEGSDVQGYDITSAMWALIIATMIMAGVVLWKGWED